MKILITQSSFGFEKDKEYPATIQKGGYFANNGTLGKFIQWNDAVIVEDGD